MVPRFMIYFITCTALSVVFISQALNAGGEEKSAQINAIELHGKLSPQESFMLRVEVELIGVDEINARMKLNPLWGMDQLSSNSKQKVISKLELIISGDLVEIPKSATRDLLEPSFPNTLKVLCLKKGGAVISFSGGTGEREYWVRLYINNGRCARREIRMLDNRAREVVYTKQF